MSLPKHFHIVCMIKNHCHAIPANVNYWCINAHSCFHYFPEIGSPLISKCFIGLFIFFYLFITFPKNLIPEISSFSQLEIFPIQCMLICVRVAERLALPTSDHSNPAGGQILPEPKRCFIARSLSC